MIEQTEEDQRLADRRFTSLLGRVFVSGRPAHETLILSLGDDGAFVTGFQPPPVGVRVRVQVGLGRNVGLLSAKGEIVRHGMVTNKFGCGIQWRDLTDDQIERLRGFGQRYPGPLSIRPDGEILWPFGEASRAIARDEILSALDTESEGPAAQTNANTNALAVALTELSRALQSSDGKRRVRFHAQGRALVPESGIPRELLAGGIGSPAVEPGATLVLGLLSQARVAHGMGCIRWKLGWPGRRPYDELVAAGAFLDRFVDHLERFEPFAEEAFAEAGQPHLYADLCRRFHRLQRFVRGVEWNVGAASALS